MNKYWNNLNEREKKMLIATAVFVFFYLYYIALYSPLSNKVTQRTQQLEEKTATLAWMNTLKQPKNTSIAKKSISNSQLLTLLANQLKAHKTLKFPYQLQQTSSGDIELSFEQVPFNLFIKWLLQLNEHYAITIKQFNANNTPTPGISQLMVIISSTN